MNCEPRAILSTKKIDESYFCHTIFLDLSFASKFLSNVLSEEESSTIIFKSL
jgi:hypothetical protein